MSVIPDTGNVSVDGIHAMPLSPRDGNAGREVSLAPSEDGHDEEAGQDQMDDDDFFLPDDAAQNEQTARSAEAMDQAGRNIAEAFAIDDYQEDLGIDDNAGKIGHPGMPDGFGMGNNKGTSQDLGPADRPAPLTGDESVNILLDMITHHTNDRFDAVKKHLDHTATYENKLKERTATQVEKIKQEANAKNEETKKQGEAETAEVADRLIKAFLLTMKTCGMDMEDQVVLEMMRDHVSETQASGVSAGARKQGAKAIRKRPAGPSPVTAISALELKKVDLGASKRPRKRVVTEEQQEALWKEYGGIKAAEEEKAPAKKRARLDGSL